MTRREQETKRRVTELISKREFKLIDIKKLVNENNLIDSDTNLEDVELEIEAHGLLSPISVVGPYEEGRYIIIDGVRRVKALEPYFKGKVPCYILGDKNTTREERKLLALGSNRVHRESYVELNIRYMQALVKNSSYSLADRMASLTGISERQARKYKNVVIYGAHKTVDLVCEGKVDITAASIIAKTLEEKVLQVKIVKAMASPEVGKQDSLAYARSLSALSPIRLEKAKESVKKKTEKELINEIKRAREKKRRRVYELETLKTLEFIIKTSPDGFAFESIIDQCKQIAEMYA